MTSRVEVVPPRTGGRPLTVVRHDRWRRLLWPAVVVVLVVTVTLRFLAFTPMWLDEAQTVEIAHRSVPGLLHALRHDGSPPLFYLLLHGWMLLVGTGTFAVRALSGVLAVAALPLAWLVARRYGAGRRGAWAATLLFAACPFAIRYATEARMYALEILLVLLGLLAFERVWTRGGAAATVGAAAVTAALVLTHYWSLFLVAVAGLGAAYLAVRGSRRARRVLVALAVGCLGFLPWLPSFWFQVRHTGAPWGSPPSVDLALLAPGGWAGPGVAGTLVATGYYVLAVLAVAGVVAERGIVLRRPLRPVPTLLIGGASATMLLGASVSAALGSAYALRYSAVALAPFLVGAAIGYGVLPLRVRVPLLAAVVALGLVASASFPGRLRSEAGRVADALTRASPRDVVVFCPDQLGPAVHRLAPHAGRQVVYPTMGSPAMVDWVDYAARNRAADPQAFARRLLAMAGRSSIWLVYAPGYPTFGDDCSQLDIDLAVARGRPTLAVHGTKHAEERERVVVFRPR